MRRLLVRKAVARVYDRPCGGRDQGLTVADVTRKTSGVADPCTMATIEHDPINGESLRDDLVTVHDEQGAAMMRRAVAAPFGSHPIAAPGGWAKLQRLLGPHGDAADHV